MTSFTRLAPLALGALVAALAPAAARAATPPPSSIVFERGGAIVSRAVPGGAERQLTPAGADHDPALSPDGGRIVFVRGRDLWTMAADGGAQAALTTDGRYHEAPTFTPDGREVVFATGTWGRLDLAAISSTKGGALRRLTATPDNDERAPSVSPAGLVAYERVGCEMPRGGGQCVYVTPLDGAGPAVNLTPETSMPGCTDRPGFRFHGVSRQPAISPDGSRIAFRGPTLCSVSSLGTDLWTMSASGAGKVDLIRDAATEDEAPAWSPDASQIAFGREGKLMTVAAGGGAPTPLTPGARASWGRAAG